ncbi:hypothetical protein DL96DRAFT_1618889 [Flagelloscypha sp. PMI_526]|nr:hypothetical protein DL96DRAFT_1618889 [Flagelloscypha sp. PMI_526]
MSLIGATSRKFDLLIIGGGPAGLAAALAASRQRHPVALFDSGVYRNALTSHMHNVPTWDHKDPAEYRAACRKELTERYSTTLFVERAIVELSKDSGLFQAKDDKGDVWEGQKVIIATGVKDIMPEAELPGYTQCWGKGVFHCLYCHGYDEADLSSTSSVGVLVQGFMAKMPTHAMRRAVQSLRFASSAVLYTHGDEELARTLTEMLPKNNAAISIDSRKISSLSLDHPDGHACTVTVGNTQVRHTFLTHIPMASARVPFTTQLPFKYSETGMEIVTKAPFYEADGVEGCFIGGDQAIPQKAVMGAVNTGMFAAVGAIDQLQNE